MKPKLSFLAALLPVALVVLACKVSDNRNSNASPQPAATTSPQAQIQPLDKGVVLTFRIETNGTRRPTVVGETNLPDETDLMISIDSRTIRYNASSKALVQGGHFQSETFSNDNSDLEAGQYNAEVLMPVALVQSPSVRAVIGEKGENLKGSLIEQGNLGVTVSRNQPFQLKADGSIVLAENKTGLATAEKNAFAILEDLKRLELLGRGMESLRVSKSIESARTCGDLMRARQPMADELRSKAEALPRPFSVWLTPIGIDLKLCVSCASFAMNDCNRAKSNLDEAAKEMRKNTSQ
ncbi:MAG TPA: hypothetical protein VMZ30_05380 [Pyrinomonadaceae bacterium]|nr:hypothetical protein [Pyrinomonadaceae bacterium]